MLSVLDHWVSVLFADTGAKSVLPCDLYIGCRAVAEGYDCGLQQEKTQIKELRDVFEVWVFNKLA